MNSKVLNKVFVIASVFAFALGFTSCSSDDSDSGKGATDTVEKTAKGLCAKGLYFTITSESSKTAKLSGADSNYYSNTTTVCTIPSYISCEGTTYTVNEIGDSIFYRFKKLTSVDIPKTVVTMGEVIFFDCENLKSATVPESVKRLGELSFSESGIEELTILGPITVVEADLCDDCDNLTKVTLPNTVTEFEAYAFAGCHLKSLTCLATAPPKMPQYGTPQRALPNSSDLVVKVPTASVSAYKADDFWKDFNLEGI